MELVKRMVVRVISSLGLLSLSTPGLVLSLPMILAWRVQESWQFKKKGGMEMNYDEVAMYKQLYLFTLLPILNTLYSLVVAYYLGYRYGILSFMLFYPFLWLTTRWFEDGMASLRALRSLYKCFTMSTAQFQDIVEKRKAAAQMVELLGAKHNVKVPVNVYDSGSFFSLLGRRRKDWNETLRPYEIPVGQ